VIWPTVRRIIAVAVGFILAVIAGGLTLFFLGARWAAAEATAYNPQNADEVSQLLNEWLGVMAFFFTVTPLLNLLPAMAVVVIGEIGRIRSVLYYILGGGASVALMPLLVTPPEITKSSAYSAEYFTIFATAGFAAGFVYWLISGRNA
jgi:hypothetical protein